MPCAFWNTHPKSFYRSIVEGCPVANGRSPCCRHCGGGWPGTKITDEAMTRAVESGNIDPSKLGCQPLQDRATMALEELHQSEVLFVAAQNTQQPSVDQPVTYDV